MKRLLLAGVMGAALLGTAAEAAPTKAYNIRMRRSDMPDTTDVQSLRDSIITGGMSDVEKAKAIWRVVFKYSHQDSPPQEQLHGCTHDLIKLVNVYGYRMCCCASTMIETLADSAGIGDAAHTPRTRGLTGHNVPELWYGNAWHMLDSSLITYFKKNDGTIASVDELHADIPGLINLSHCPFANPVGEWFPANTHNLNDSRTEYSSVSGECIDGFSNGWSVGHRNLLTLREGETLVRSCTVPAAHHVNEDIGGPPGCIDDRAGSGLEFQYMNMQIPDQSATYYYVHPSYHGGIVGNGTLTYAPNLAQGGYRGGIESETNIACTADDSQGPAIHLAATGTGTIIIRMDCPYVFLDGDIAATFKRAAGGDSVKVYISTNNMQDWTEIYNCGTTGNSIAANIDFKANVFRRYCYYLKFEFISSISPTNVGMEALTITNLIQHAQRAMPFLVQGNNQIVVDAGPATATLTINPRITTSTLEPTFNKNETLTTMHAIINGMTTTVGGLWSTGAGSNVVFPVTVPGDIVAVRFGATFRLRDANDWMDMQVSATGPSSGFVQVARVQGPDPKLPKFVTYNGVPAGVRNIWVRFNSGPVYNTVGISGHVCVYVDYTEAGAVIKPFKIKHEWTENGVPKSWTETVTTVPHTYSINCAAEPTMTAVTTWVENVADTEAPAVTVASAQLAGTVSDTQSPLVNVSVAGVALGAFSGAWTSQDVALTGATTNFSVVATDSSSNARTVNIGKVPNMVTRVSGTKPLTKQVFEEHRRQV